MHYTRLLTRHMSSAQLRHKRSKPSSRLGIATGGVTMALSPNRPHKTKKWTNCFVWQSDEFASHHKYRRTILVWFIVINSTLENNHIIINYWLIITLYFLDWPFHHDFWISRIETLLVSATSGLMSPAPWGEMNKNWLSCFLRPKFMKI